MLYANYIQPFSLDAHLSEFAHADIAHTNRSALDAVSGTNTGDQDLSGLALSGHTHTGDYEPANANIQSHIGTVTGNPHAVTAADVGLGSVQNTSINAGTAAGQILYWDSEKWLQTDAISYDSSAQKVTITNNSVSESITTLQLTNSGGGAAKLAVGPITAGIYHQIQSAGKNPGLKLEVNRTNGGAAVALIDVYANKTNTPATAYWGGIGAFGSFGTAGEDVAPACNYLYFGCESGFAYNANTFRLYPDKTAYFDGTIAVGVLSAANAKLEILSTSAQLSLDYSDSVRTSLATDSSGYLSILPSGKQVNLNVGANSSGVTDLIINPTTKSTGNFASFQINGAGIFGFRYDGFFLTDYITPARFNTVQVTKQYASSGTMFYVTPAWSGTSSGTSYASRIFATYTSNAGSGNFYVEGITPTYNFAGAQSGSVIDLLIDATETNLNGATHLFQDWRIGGVSKVKLTNTGQLSILGDSVKTIWGAGSDMSLYYDGTKGHIKADEVAASDLLVTCGAGKTLALANVVYEDLNFDPTASGGPPTTFPDAVTINNVFHVEFTSANNQTCGSSQEIPHNAYLGATTYYPHLHLFLKSGESSGTTGATFRIYWELRQSTGTTSGSVDLSVTSAQLATTAGENKYTLNDATGFTGATEIGAQLSLRLARTAGDAGDIIPTTYGIHYPIDTIGSRSVDAK